MIHPPDNPMNWPMDLFEEAMVRAELLEAKMFDFKIDKTRERVMKIGNKKRSDAKLSKLGIPPLFVD